MKTIRLIEQGLRNPGDNRLSREQVELAWNYAYRFFFEYPCPFPWHLLDFWDELEAWPVSRLLSSEGMDAFAATFDQLVGEPRRYEAFENEEIKAR